MPVFKVYRDGIEMHNGANEKIYRKGIPIGIGEDAGSHLYMINAIYKKYIVENAQLSPHGAESDVFIYDIFRSTYLFKLMQKNTMVSCSGMLDTFYTFFINWNGSKATITASWVIYDDENNVLTKDTETDKNLGEIDVNDGEALYIGILNNRIAFFPYKDIPIDQISDEEAFNLIFLATINPTINDLFFRFATIQNVIQYVHWYMLSSIQYQIIPEQSLPPRRRKP